MMRSGIIVVLRKLLACTFAPLALFAAAPSPVPLPPGHPAGDHLLVLAGAWACRSVDGAITRTTGVYDGGTLKIHDDIVDQSGNRSSFDDRYTFDLAAQRWHVESGYGGGFRADAPAWTEGLWTVQGNDIAAVPRRITLQLLPGGDVRRSFSYGDDRGNFATDVLELCTPGTTPPAADACIADRYPATTLEPAMVNTRFVPANAYPGLVQVVVSLNERSEVTNVRVQSSTNAALNAPALAAARASKFRTAIVHCKPVAADYIFSVSFGR